jgi:hypothetical protein
MFSYLYLAAKYKMAKELEISKSPYQIETWTPEQIQEIALCSDPETGPLYFLTHFYKVKHPTRGSILFSPFSFQSTMLHNINTYKYNVVLFPRQSGKCCHFSTLIKVCDTTGKTYELPIGELYDHVTLSINIESYAIPSVSQPSTQSSNIVPRRSISDQVNRKFINVTELTGWKINTDTGWQPIIDIKKTVRYEVWEVTLSNGVFLKCADTHIVFDSTMNEIFVKNLHCGDTIQTKDGLSTVVNVENTFFTDYMYDIGVNSVDHRYYTNGILSHNTTTAAGYLLWYAMFIPDSTILIAAHKYSGAQEIMQRIRFAYETTPNHIRAGVTSYNKGSIDFDNGSRIVSATTTENTGRGMSISLLYVDEMAFLRNSIAREFWSSITPTLATGGNAIITSTPNSDDDQFWDIWTEANKCFDEYGNETELGRNGFKAFKATWRDHPERDEQWAKTERSRLSEAEFRREHECEPIVFEETLIDGIKLATLTSKDPIEHQGQVRWFKKPSREYTYLIALDPCLGTGGDNAAIQVLELPTFEQVAEWKHNRTIIQQQVRILKEIVHYLFTITNSRTTVYYSVENNTLGEAALVAINELGEDSFEGVFLHEPIKIGATRRYRKGFTTTQQSKTIACAKFKQMVENDKLKLYSKPLLSELKTFVRSNQSYAARTGDTDDLVMSMLLTIRMAQVVQNYDVAVYDKMREVDKEMVMPMPFIMI